MEQIVIHIKPSILGDPNYRVCANCHEDKDDVKAYGVGGNTIMYLCHSCLKGLGGT